jgi:hypothetical protein
MYLAVAELRGTLPSDLVAIGLQPGRLEMSSGLRPELDCRLDVLLTAVVERLERWGCECGLRPAFPESASLMT